MCLVQGDGSIIRFPLNKYEEVKKKTERKKERGKHGDKERKKKKQGDKERKKESWKCFSTSIIRFPLNKYEEGRRTQRKKEQRKKVIRKESDEKTENKEKKTEKKNYHLWVCNALFF